MTAILTEIQLERELQDVKWGEQNHSMLHPTAAYSDPHLRSWIAEEMRDRCNNAFSMQEGDWFMILQEEIAEAFEQAALGNTEALRTELIQVAAVVVAMIECLDRNGL